MPRCTVLHVEAFSNEPGMGNPAGLVLDADSFSPDQMQRIAKMVGFNETVFVCHSEKADYRFLFFTPGHEIDLCGHGTVAAVATLGRKVASSLDIRIETRAGILAVRYDAASETVQMRQAAPQFKDFSGDKLVLAEVLGIAPELFRPGLPIVYGSTGTWTLLVPVQSEDAILSMRAQTARFPDVLTELARASIHPFCRSRPGRRI